MLAWVFSSKPIEENTGRTHISHWNFFFFFFFCICLLRQRDFPCTSVSKESNCNAGDPGLIAGFERSPGEVNGNQLQYSYLGNPMDREVWQVTVQGVARVGQNLATKIPPPKTDLGPIAAAAAARSLQSCPTLWYPIDGSPSGSPIPGILQARTLEWVAISFSNAWKWKVKVK